MLSAVQSTRALRSVPSALGHPDGAGLRADIQDQPPVRRGAAEDDGGRLAALRQGDAGGAGVGPVVAVGLGAQAGEGALGIVHPQQQFVAAGAGTGAGGIHAALPLGGQVLQAVRRFSGGRSGGGRRHGGAGRRGPRPGAGGQQQAGGQRKGGAEQAAFHGGPLPFFRSCFYGSPRFFQRCIKRPDAKDPAVVDRGVFFCVSILLLPGASSQRHSHTASATWQARISGMPTAKYQCRVLWRNRYMPAQHPAAPPSSAAQKQHLFRHAAAGAAGAVLVPAHQGQAGQVGGRQPTRPAARGNTAWAVPLLSGTAAAGHAALTARRLLLFAPASTF